MNNQRGFIFPSFLLSPTGIMGMAIAALVLTNFITYKLWRSEVEDYAKFKAEVVAQQQALEAEAERRRLASELASKDAAQGWLAALDYWKRNGGIRVQPVRCEGGLRSVPGATLGTGPASAEPRFGPFQDAPTTISVDQCEARLNNAVTDAAQVEHLRAWVADQRKASTK